MKPVLAFLLGALFTAEAAAVPLSEMAVVEGIVASIDGEDQLTLTDSTEQAIIISFPYAARLQPGQTIRVQGRFEKQEAGDSVLHANTVMRISEITTAPAVSVYAQPTQTAAPVTAVEATPLPEEIPEVSAPEEPAPPPAEASVPSETLELPEENETPKEESVMPSSSYTSVGSKRLR